MKLFAITSVVVACLACVVNGEMVSKCQSAGMFAMTWDDGPAEYTGQLLDIASKKGVRFTFHLTTQFLTDPNVQSMVKKIAAAGHLIGIRTEPSWDLFAMTPDQIKSAIARSGNVMANFIGYYPRFLRVPYKGWNNDILAAIEATGLIVTQHNLETYDYTGDADRIFNAFSLSMSLKSPGTGNFISVQRDSIANSVGVTAKIIDAIKANGYKLVTLDQCVGLGDMTKNKEPLKGADGKAAMGPLPDDIPSNGQANPNPMGGTDGVSAGGAKDAGIPAAGPKVDGKGAGSKNAASRDHSPSLLVLAFAALLYFFV
jgi:peptidoglycan/xylan/chitin deacetylase (PgdA/CDA1 family)